MGEGGVLLAEGAGLVGAPVVGELVLLPQQLQRDTGAFELLVQLGPIGLLVARAAGHRGWMQPVCRVSSSSSRACAQDRPAARARLAMSLTRVLLTSAAQAGSRWLRPAWYSSWRTLLILLMGTFGVGIASLVASLNKAREAMPGCDRSPQGRGGCPPSEWNRARDQMERCPRARGRRKREFKNFKAKQKKKFVLYTNRCYLWQ